MTRSFLLDRPLSIATAALVGILSPAGLAGDAVAVSENGAVSVAGREFEPRVTVLFRPDDPEMELRRSGLDRVSYNVLSWVTEGDGEGLKQVDTGVSAGDGLDAETLGGDIARRSPDLFAAAPRLELEGAGSLDPDGTVRWSFPSAEGLGSVGAVVDPDAEPAPRVTLTFRAARSGFFSVGYTGAPAVEPAEAAEIWQPFLWTEKRFPALSYLTASYRCPIPTVLVEYGGVTTGVVVSPEHLPFQPLPMLENSQYGVVLRDAEGLARPMAFAPVFGSEASALNAGDEVSLTFYLYASRGTLTETYEKIAREFLGFEDSRRNLPGTNLNDTLRNVIEYGLSEWSRFREDLRGCSYETDVPDAVKNVSALNPLSIALATDDARPFERRFKPIYEFLLSREKKLFNLDPEVRVQSPSQSMIGPSANISELAVIHAVSDGRDRVSRLYAEHLLGVNRRMNLNNRSDGRVWQSRLALDEAVDDPRHWRRGEEQLEEYLAERVNTPATDFSDRLSRGMFFWNSFTPHWMDLYWAYRRTGDERLLRAAHEGARRYAQFCWMGPEIPDGTVRVNEGGYAPHYWYMKAQGHERMRAEEREVPAWWVSEIGLTPESSGTSHGHRGIFMANYAPFMLRIAQDTGDGFLRAIARHAVVGRYRNFPGYHINTARTDVYMSADYPLRDHKELGYNSFHYNHVWPKASILLDYLVADAYDASNAAIDFPGRFIEGYAYLRSLAPGDMPGRFYDREGVTLWMPKGLVETGDDQLNWIAGRVGDEVLVAVMNQSFEPVRSTVSVDASRAGLPAGSVECDAWVQNEPTTVRMIDGSVRVSVPARGIAAFAVPGCDPRVEFQDRLLSERGSPLGDGAHATIEAGDVRAMLLSMSPSLTSAYVYSREPMHAIERMTLRTRELGGGGWSERTDVSYPFEFRVEPESGGSFGGGGLEVVVEIERPDGTVKRSEARRLVE